MPEFVSSICQEYLLIYESDLCKPAKQKMLWDADLHCPELVPGDPPPHKIFNVEYKQ